MQGIDRQWLRRTKYDFYFLSLPIFSEQAIEMAEIYAQGNGGPKPEDVRLSGQV